MSKKTTGIIFITVTGLLLILSFYSVISGRTIVDNVIETWNVDYYTEYVDLDLHPAPEVESIRHTINGDASLEELLFDTSFNDVNQHEQKVLKALNLSDDEEAFVSYSHKTNDLIDLTGSVSLLNVEGEGNYRFMLTPAIGQVPVDFRWVVEDLAGNEVYTITDITTSTQGNVTLSDGIYFIYNEIGKTEDSLKYKVTIEKY